MTRFKHVRKLLLYLIATGAVWLTGCASSSDPAFDQVQSRVKQFRTMLDRHDEPALVARYLDGSDLQNAPSDDYLAPMLWDVAWDANVADNDKYFLQIIQLLSDRIDPMVRPFISDQRALPRACAGKTASLAAGKIMLQSKKLKAIDENLALAFVLDCTQYGSGDNVAKMLQYFAEKGAIPQKVKQAILQGYSRSIWIDEKFELIDYLSRGSDNSFNNAKVIRESFHDQAQGIDLLRARLKYLKRQGPLGAPFGPAEMSELLAFYDQTEGNDRAGYLKETRDGKAMDVALALAQNGFRLPTGDANLAKMVFELVKRNKTVLVDRLLAAGADPNGGSSGGSLLRFAINAKNSEMALMVLRHGALIPDDQNPSTNLLLLADANGMPKVVSALQERKIKLPDLYGQSRVAIEANDLERARYWLRAATKFTPDSTRKKRADDEIGKLERKIAEEARQSEKRRLAAQNSARSSAYSSSSESPQISYVSVDVGMVGGGFVTAQKLTLSGGPGSWNGVGSFGSIQNSGRGVGGQYSFYAEFNNGKACSGVVNLSGRKQTLKISVYDDCRDAGTWEN